MANCESPLDSEENDQDANLAFTLVARNEAAKQMWADPYNSSRYVPASFTRKAARDWSQEHVIPKQPVIEHEGNRPTQNKRKKDVEPALKFLFNNRPKNFSKGYVLGSCHKLCDALLGDPEDLISEETLAFTFNKDHELIMNVTSITQVWVKYHGQKGVDRHRFTWIFPRGQEPIRVRVADLFEFDVVLPKYGTKKGRFHKNCEAFLSSAANGNLLADNINIDSTTVVRQPSGTSPPKKSFYLRGKKVGSGSYGDVYKVLGMPDGKIHAAKEFEEAQCFRQEADMLKKVCKTYHENIVQFVEEWFEDHKPLLIMEYMAGGSLVARMTDGLKFGETAKLANQTLSALLFLHDQGIMHRDLKPANILCTTTGHYKIADFGVSKEVAPLLSRQGTAEYMAPEVHDRAPYSFPADIWSLGVVLFECLYPLPDGFPGRRWCEKLSRKCRKNCRECEDMNASDALELTKFIATAMLKMDANERYSARKCLETYDDLWVDINDSEDSKAGSGANTPTQTHPNGSFAPNPYTELEGNKARAETSSTIRWNGKGITEARRDPQNFRNEDGATVTGHGKAKESLLGSIFSSPPSVGEEELYDPSSVLPWAPSTGGTKLYDPANVIPWPASIGETLYDPGRTILSVRSRSETQTRTGSISNTSIKRRRDSDVSAEGIEEDGSVTPGRRAPYHPGNETAAPGRGFFPPSPWVSSPNRVRSGKSEPSQRQRNRAAGRSARGP